MEFNRTWEAIQEKLDKAIEEDKAYPALLIGDYKRAYPMSLNNSALFDEFIEGDHWREFELDPEDDYSEGFEKFTDLVKKGYRFGDYQQFVTLADRLAELKETADKLEGNGAKPTELLEPAYDAVRVRCNGHKDSVDLRGYNDSYIELVELLEELDNL